MEITKFDRKNLDQVRGVINTALETALADFGLSAKLGNISYLENTFSAKLTVNCGTTADGERAEFEKYAPMFGLTADTYGKMVTHNGKLFTVVGLKPRSRKYPVIARANGVRYKLPLEAITNI